MTNRRRRSCKSSTTAASRCVVRRAVSVKMRTFEKGFSLGRVVPPLPWLRGAAAPPPASAPNARPGRRPPRPRRPAVCNLRVRRSPHGSLFSSHPSNPRVMQSQRVGWDKRRFGSASQRVRRTGGGGGVPQWSPAHGQRAFPQEPRKVALTRAIIPTLRRTTDSCRSVPPSVPASPHQ